MCFVEGGLALASECCVPFNLHGLGCLAIFLSRKEHLADINIGLHRDTRLAATEPPESHA